MFFKRFKIKKWSKKLKLMQAQRVHNAVSDELLKKEIEGYHALAKIYETLIGHKKWPYAYQCAIESYRAAASMNDSEAQYILGKKMIEEGKLRDSLQKEGPLASDANQKLLLSAFEEGHAYLKASDELGHILAKRYRGLCYINGWGVAVDREFGFDLVVVSIDRENSWDKVAQIFKSIGLNKPEFFSALAKHTKRA